MRVSPMREVGPWTLAVLAYVVAATPPLNGSTCESAIVLEKHRRRDVNDDLVNAYHGAYTLERDKMIPGSCRWKDVDDGEWISHSCDWTGSDDWWLRVPSGMATSQDAEGKSTEFAVYACSSNLTDFTIYKGSCDGSQLAL